MKINTCYTVDIKSQYIFKDGQAVGIRRVDEAVMKATRTACLDALKFCVNAFLSDWDSLEELSCLMRKRVPAKLHAPCHRCRCTWYRKFLCFQPQKLGETVCI